jgi:hypothetical protein
LKENLEMAKKKTKKKATKTKRRCSACHKLGNNVRTCQGG